jgi:hypothetical protein
MLVASRIDQLQQLVDELLDAHEDTVRLATAPATAVEWQVHLDYLRALQRVAQESLARIAA